MDNREIAKLQALRADCWGALATGRGGGRGGARIAQWKRPQVASFSLF